MYRREVDGWLGRQFESPDSAFVSFLAKELHDGPRTKNVVALFGRIIPEALKAHVNRVVNERLRRAIAQGDGDDPPDPKPPGPKPPDPRDVLSARLDDNEFSSAQPGRTAASVMLNALTWMWSQEGAWREAIISMLDEDGVGAIIRRDASEFSATTKPSSIGAGAPWINTGISTKRKLAFLNRVRGKLPEPLQSRVAFEIIPARADGNG